MFPDTWLQHVPNVITTARIVLIPLFVLVYITVDEYHWVAGLLFAIAALTDWLDGFIARKWQVTTKFGAFLDPVADKLVVVTALVLLIGQHATLWLTLPGLIICARELIISALREWMAEMNRRTDVSVNMVAKVKTSLQMFAIVILMANAPEFGPWVIFGFVLIYLATIMTIWSMVVHLMAAMPTLKMGIRLEIKP